MDMIRDLTVRQAVVLSVVVLIVLVVAVIAFTISQQEQDPYEIPTPTLSVQRSSGDIEIIPATLPPTTAP